MPEIASDGIHEIAVTDDSLRKENLLVDGRTLRHFVSAAHAP
jgi:hypothetical protein